MASRRRRPPRPLVKNRARREPNGNPDADPGTQYATTAPKRRSWHGELRIVSPNLLAASVKKRRPPRAWVGAAKPPDPAELLGPRGLTAEVLRGDEEVLPLQRGSAPP